MWDTVFWNQYGWIDQNRPLLSWFLNFLDIAKWSQKPKPNLLTEHALGVQLNTTDLSTEHKINDIFFSWTRCSVVFFGCSVRSFVCVQLRMCSVVWESKFAVLYWKKDNHGWNESLVKDKTSFFYLEQTETRLSQQGECVSLSVE